MEVFPSRRPNPGEQFFIGYPGVLWCTLKGGRQPPDGFLFEVINGGWSGTYYPERGEVLVHFTKETYYAGPIVWIGKAPFSYHNYNEAIRWIEDLVTKEHQCV